MLAAYFDESGTHGAASNTVVVAGYIGEADDWLKFGMQWSSAMTDYRLRDGFHMKRYASNARGYRWGRKREARLSRLHTITRRAVKAGIGVVLDKDAWEKNVKTPADHAYFGTSHYDFCATAALGMIAKWCEDHEVYEGIAHVFDRGAVGWKEFQRTYDKAYANDVLRKAYRLLGGLELKDKTIFQPIQAADIAAYSLYAAGAKSTTHLKGRGWGDIDYLRDLKDVPVYLVTVNDEILRMMKEEPEYKVHIDAQNAKDKARGDDSGAEAWRVLQRLEEGRHTDKAEEIKGSNEEVAS